MAEETLNHDVKVEDLGPTKKRLVITVPADAVTEKIDDSMMTLSSEANIPGFRRGKAPKALVERRFGSAVRDETRSQLIAEAYSAAIESQNIKTVGEPEPDEGVKFDELVVEAGKSLEFAIVVEVMPPFDTPDFSTFTIKKPMLEIEAEHIDKELGAQCLRHGTPEACDGPYKAGDRLVGHIVATKKGDDEAFFEHNEAVVVVPDEENDGRGVFLGIMIEGLYEKLSTCKVGDTITLEATGPEGHEREDIRGADIELAYTVSAGHTAIPAKPEEVMELFGFDSIDTLRDQIKTALEQRRDREIADAMRSQVNEQLLDAIDFPLPEKLSQAQVERELNRTRLELLYKGVAEDVVEEKLAEIREESAADAKRRLRLFLILNRLAEDLEIQVNEQEINGRIMEIAIQRGERPEQVRKALVDNNQINGIAITVREHKTSDKIVESATVTEISADDWKAELEARAGGETKAPKTTKKKTTKKKTTKKKTSKSAE